MEAVKDVLTRILGGDRDAYRAVVQEFGPGIRAFLAARLFSAELVDDLSQETFIAAFENLKTFDLEADLGAWLRTIARNKLNSHLRRVYAHGDALEVLRARVVEAALEEGAETGSVDALRHCLEKLPARLHEVVRARYFDRQRVGAIAQRLGTTTAAISSLLFRSRKELEGCMGKTP
jgi:RNA polymerase sigma-70 factor, ECF subfamily